MTRAHIDTAELPDAIRLEAKINEHGNGEMFFANKVVLCEGRDDEFALKTLFSNMGVDLDGRSVSILGVGGKGNLVDYAALLGRLGTPWCAVIDEDRLPDGSYKKNAEAIVRDIEALQTSNDILLQYEVDLEHCFGMGRNKDKPDRPEHKATPEWQQAQIGALAADNLSTRCPLLYAVAAAGKNWIER